MSTFNGLVSEFPDIRIDYFRGHSGRRPPLACFLSHVHSDHLTGLESLSVYCSAATREMLLRLERRPCRINFAKGILEKRVQTYEHLKKLLKPLPLQTPTMLELEPHTHIQVTLFDANHCPGAVMFLIEGQGKAVLYTGDIRSEPWFVNALARSPSLVEYTMGLKTLDTIYLDTSFTDDVGFQTKAEGIRELLQNVARYPANTVFHFQAWTYGYEDVWIALSKALKSKIHVDDYKMSMYRSLMKKAHAADKRATLVHLAPETPALVGFMCGNKQHGGCLTLDDRVRLHSCEKEHYCPTVQQCPVVWIEPLVCRLLDGHNVAEVGTGGGGDDLEREAELDFGSADELEALLEAARARDDLAPETREHFESFIQRAIAAGRAIIPLQQTDFGDDNTAVLANALRPTAAKLSLERVTGTPLSESASTSRSLPRSITFPYSRHSSLPELRHLVDAFKPKDIWPCTANLSEWVKKDISIRHLFGQQCSGSAFRHDALMTAYVEEHQPTRSLTSTQSTSASFDIPIEESLGVPTHPTAAEYTVPHSQSNARANIESEAETGRESKVENSRSASRKRDFVDYETVQYVNSDGDDDEIDLQGSSQETVLSDCAREIRAEAYRTMLRNANGNVGGNYISLLSTTGNHWTVEAELGED